MSASEEVCVQVLCKYCKNRTISGPKCVTCGANYHASCAKRLKKAKFINENEINCCVIGEEAEQRDSNQAEPVVQANNLSVLVNEINYLKTIIFHKDVIISELREKIEILNTNVKLSNAIEYLSKVEKQIQQKPPVEIPSKNAWNSTNNIPKWITEKQSTKENDNSDKADNGSIPIGTTMVSESSKSESHNNNDEDDGFTLVQNRKKANKSNRITSQDNVQKDRAPSRTRPLIGSATNEGLKGIPKRAYLHVSRLDPNTTDSEITDYVKRFVSEVKCEKMSSKHLFILQNNCVSPGSPQCHGSRYLAIRSASKSFFFKRTTNPRPG